MSDVASMAIGRREDTVTADGAQGQHLAALAVESGSEWMTTDRDYSRFPGLRWRDPGA